MKGIRGLLEKDFRLFRYQGGQSFSCSCNCGVIFKSCRKYGDAILYSIYITSVMAVYSGKYN